MKSELIEEKVGEQEFPKLMITKDKVVIVLFFCSGTGTVVRGANHSPRHSLGYTSDGWSMDNFEDFNGKVILSNK